MLAYLLAIVVVIGSVTFYLAAFFVPEIHRRQDFVWSGVGMFYALVLWSCAGRITGAVLLGQLASIALLSWLGWQTLTLRRELTPAAVQTPVSWTDLQRWWQTIQRAWGHYLQKGSFLAILQALGGDIRRAITTFQQRVAGPRGQSTSSEPIPPLRRSPAYEFETEAGQGESVPSEFATVPPPAHRDRAPAPATPEPVTANQPSTTAPPVRPAVPPPAPPAQPPQPDPQPQQAVSPAPSRQTRQPGKWMTAPSPVSPPPQPAPASDAPTESSPPPPPTPKLRPRAKTSPAAQGGWLTGLVRRFRTPQPTRPVIEIPPRPPSIPKSSDAQAVDAEDKNWVDAGDTDPVVSPAGNGPPPNESPPPEPPTPEPATPEEEESNWPD